MKEIREIKSYLQDGIRAYLVDEPYDEMSVVSGFDLEDAVNFAVDHAKSMIEYSRVEGFIAPHKAPPDEQLRAIAKAQFYNEVGMSSDHKGVASQAVLSEIREDCASDKIWSLAFCLTTLTFIIASMVVS